MKQKANFINNIFRMFDLEVTLCFLKHQLKRELKELISSAKDLYYEKLNNPLLQAKNYWSILKIFYSDKKIQNISSLLVDNKFATGIQTKANIFNKVLLSNVHPWKIIVCFEQIKCF